VIPADLDPTKPLHATAIALGPQGALFLGASGSGKSELALALIALGAELISDDLVRVTKGAEGWPMLSGPGRMAGVIEARGVGLLTVRHRAEAPLSLIVDLDRVETARLPALVTTPVFDQPIPVLSRVDSLHFPAILHAYLTGGRLSVSPP